MKKTFFSVLILVFLFTACNDPISSDSTESASSSTTSSATSSSTGKNSTGTSTTQTSGTSTDSGTSTESTESETSSESSSPSSETSSDSSSTEITYTYDSSLNANIFEISYSTSSITIGGLSGGQTIFLTKTNPTSSAISSSYTRYVTSADGISLFKSDISSSSSSGSGTTRPSGPRHDCTSLSLNLSLPQIEESASRSASSTITKTTPASYTQDDIDSATRSIYIDQDSNISTFKAETATLRAIGEKCYVWVVSENWSASSSSGEKINSEIAKKIASNFDSMYSKIRNVFGCESDYLSTNTSLTSKISMNDYSETGTIVNIVIYDIGKDYSNGTNSGDIVGYFYAKDYFYLSNASSVYKYSNKGKYFYIDGYFAANYTSDVYSTLAHEFQHMIDFSVKSMENGLSSSTAHNEMKSMLCEDIMYSTLCELDSDFNLDAAPASRLPLFNRHYSDVGLEYKSTSPEVYYSYSNNYAFGAWLIRNNGGIRLLNEIAMNSYVDEKSITRALSSIGQSTVTMEELLKNYTVACTISLSGTGFSNEPDESDLALNGVSYSLEPIDLWNLATYLPETYESCKDSTNYYKFDGPVLYSYNEQATLRPYGITLQKVGTATKEEVTINFNTSGISSSQRAYIIIE